MSCPHSAFLFPLLFRLTFLCVNEVQRLEILLPFYICMQITLVALILTAYRQLNDGNKDEKKFE